MIQVGSHEWVNPLYVAMIEGGPGQFGTKAGHAIVTLSCGKRIQTNQMPRDLLKALTTEQPK